LDSNVIFSALYKRDKQTEEPIKTRKLAEKEILAKSKQRSRHKSTIEFGLPCTEVRCTFFVARKYCILHPVFKDAVSELIWHFATMTGAGHCNI
jgi:hypothetical protein